MSQVFFTKLDENEVVTRLSLLSSSHGMVTIWEKGEKEKFKYNVLKYHRDLNELVLNPSDKKFSSGKILLCSFELRGMSYFSEVIFQTSIGGHEVLQFKAAIFKSERRANFRLLAYPLHKIWAIFNLKTADGNQNVLQIKDSQAQVFKSFLKMVDDNSLTENQNVKILIHDLSLSGIGFNIGKYELDYFKKDTEFKDTIIKFQDEIIEIPSSKVAYVIDYVSSDNKGKRYKVGLHFGVLSATVEDRLSSKINSLLREHDDNAAFENFIK